MYMEYIGKISALVEDSSTSNVILLGDFNAAINTLFYVNISGVTSVYDVFAWTCMSFCVKMYLYVTMSL